MSKLTGSALLAKVRRFLTQRGGRPEAEPLDPREGYRRWAATYDEPPTMFQQLEAEVREGWTGGLDGARVLDLGAGRGRASDHAIAQGASQSVAIDASLAMLVSGSKGRRHGDRLMAAVGDVLALPLRPGTYDLVIAALVLGHVSDLKRAFAETRLILRPGGTLVVTDFHPEATARGWRRSFDDRSTGTTESVLSYPHSVENYVEALESAGFTLMERVETRWRDQPVVLALRCRLGPDDGSSQ